MHVYIFFLFEYMYIGKCNLNYEFNICLQQIFGIFGIPPVESHHLGPGISASRTQIYLTGCFWSISEI